MDALINSLLPLYARERAAGRPLALAVVVKTAGSTYSKWGTPLLLALDGDYAGLLSGGCLEGDLREHAQQVIADGAARLFSYDMRGPDDALYGLGAGCEGAMDIFMMRVGPMNGWQPLSAFQAALTAHCPMAVGLVIESTTASPLSGEVLLPGAAAAFEIGLAAAAHSGTPAWLSQTPQLRVFALPLTLPPRILLLGAGPDACPVLEFAVRMGWKVTVYDHRAALAMPERLPGAEQVLLGRPESLAERLALNSFDAAVVISHHLHSDAAYLRVLANSTIDYVGLLGPAPRRERLRADVGADFALLQQRLHAPVGLPLGGRSSAAIALSIVAEIHSWLQQRADRSPAASR
jgi:xanthine dehydrogenase accessory factor